MVSKHLFNGLAFRSPLHPRALRNLRARPPRALRSVGLDSGTLWTAYLRVLSQSIFRHTRTNKFRFPTESETFEFATHLTRDPTQTRGREKPKGSLSQRPTQHPTHGTRRSKSPRGARTHNLVGGQTQSLCTERLKHRAASYVTTYCTIHYKIEIV